MDANLIADLDDEVTAMNKVDTSSSNLIKNDNFNEMRTFNADSEDGPKQMRDKQSMTPKPAFLSC